LTQQGFNDIIKKNLGEVAMPTTMDPTTMPFTRIEGMTFAQRGKLTKQNFRISDQIEVSYEIGDLMKAKGHVTMIPQFPHKPSTRSVAGTFIRSDYDRDMAEFIKTYDGRTEPYAPSSIVSMQVLQGTEETTLGKPLYFFHAITVVNDPKVQFNIVRETMPAAASEAFALLSEIKADTIVINLPAFGTGPEGTLLGPQSARAIFAGIGDSAAELDGYLKSFDKKIRFNVIIKDEPMYRPLIDDFNMVKNDASYKDVPEEGEYGQKKVNPLMVHDHIKLEDEMTRVYQDMKAYQANYPTYDCEL
jgi:hypothetical protein